MAIEHPPIDTRTFRDIVQHILGDPAAGITGLRQVYTHRSGRATRPTTRAWCWPRSSGSSWKSCCAVSIVFRRSILLPFWICSALTAYLGIRRVPRFNLLFPLAIQREALCLPAHNWPLAPRQVVRCIFLKRQRGSFLPRRNCKPSFLFSLKRTRTRICLSWPIPPQKKRPGHLWGHSYRAQPLSGP